MVSEFLISFVCLNGRMEAEVSERPQQQVAHHQQQQQPQPQHPLTIFYDGKISVSDVTELQARSILMLANKEMEKRVMTPTGSEPSSPILLQSPHNMYSPGTGLSMKRSLQRFLQKRKNRVQETSPYHHELINVKLSKSSRENK
ncbi:Protein TIFY 5A isoform B [Glycine soja]|uniref:Protein TIFY n=1 Tax=Glycine soja TaxID=3848 RepID=A0A445JC71_GLYSO|nr:Protein TIFY 5A isoform B [Glycine soja]